MQDFAIAVKAFIIKDGQVLLLRRKPTDRHQPGQWDIPGGRLERGENPFDGVKREVREETGLEIETVMPLDIQHFTRDDGQRITMIIFWCRLIGDAAGITLSEHDAYEWRKIEDTAALPAWLAPVSEAYLTYIKTDHA